MTMVYFYDLCGFIFLIMISSAFKIFTLKQACAFIILSIVVWIAEWMHRYGSAYARIMADDKEEEERLIKRAEEERDNASGEEI
jgi:positive regulator of sigma E activity